MPTARVLTRLLLFTIGISHNKATCPRGTHLDKLKFSLVRTCQRSEMPAIAYKNVFTLEDCVREGKLARGLALNFGTRLRSKQMVGGSDAFAILLTRLQQITRPNSTHNKENRRSVWQQPQHHFNCHILACPENNTIRSLVNDSRYDYYSLYGEPIATRNYTCVPQVGLFQLQVRSASFVNATLYCRNATDIGGVAMLAHVASALRTDAFAALLRNYNEAARQQRERQHTLAYVGLHFNRSYSSEAIEYRNTEQEHLHCFQYAAWAPGHPLTGEILANVSCVAVSDGNTWLTVDCERELPSICEIYTSRSVLNETFITVGTCAPKTP
ncbi:PREDICTED: uncharacterized protein LOC108978212 [Bactrocera latifrons]|uniref:uncharacterized protein LOC108978212 n=1 Tax=Bactrocera latifrons TaxID=174628 RepID=UPI0008DD6F2A|nr:PREDICTED: uncharacterized protein LOC108978212 [Bactrocera latifrons]